MKSIVPERSTAQNILDIPSTVFQRFRENLNEVERNFNNVTLPKLALMMGGLGTVSGAAVAEEIGSSTPTAAGSSVQANALLDPNLGKARKVEIPLKLKGRFPVSSAEIHDVTKEEVSSLIRSEHDIKLDPNKFNAVVTVKASYSFEAARPHLESRLQIDPENVGLGYRIRIPNNIDGKQYLLRFTATDEKGNPVQGEVRRDFTQASSNYYYFIRTNGVDDLASRTLNLEVATLYINETKESLSNLGDGRFDAPRDAWLVSALNDPNFVGYEPEVASLLSRQGLVVSDSSIPDIQKVAQVVRNFVPFVKFDGPTAWTLTSLLKDRSVAGSCTSLSAGLAAGFIQSHLDSTIYRGFYPITMPDGSLRATTHLEAGVAGKGFNMIINSVSVRPTLEESLRETNNSPLMILSYGGTGVEVDGLVGMDGIGAVAIVVVENGKSKGKYLSLREVLPVSATYKATPVSAK